MQGEVSISLDEEGIGALVGEALILVEDSSRNRLEGLFFQVKHVVVLEQEVFRRREEIYSFPSMIQLPSTMLLVVEATGIKESTAILHHGITNPSKSSFYTIHNNTRRKP